MSNLNIIHKLILTLSFSICSNSVFAGDFDDGVKAFDNKDYYKAIEYFNKIAKLEPTNPDIHLKLSQCYQELFDIEKFNYEHSLYQKLKKELFQKNHIKENNLLITDVNTQENNIESTENVATINITQKSLSKKNDDIAFSSKTNILTQDTKQNDKEDKKNLEVSLYKEFKTWSPEIKSVALSSNNNFLAFSTGGATDINHKEPPKLFLYNFKNNQVITSIDINGNFVAKNLYFSKDEKLLYITKHETTGKSYLDATSFVSSFDTKNLKFLSKKPITKDKENLAVTELSKDNKKIVMSSISNGSNILRVFDNKISKLITEISFSDFIFAPSADFFKISNNSKFIGIRYDKGIRFYNALSGEKMLDIDTKDFFVIRFDFSPSDNEIACIDNKGNIQVFSLGNGSLIDSINKNLITTNYNSFYANGARNRINYSKNGKLITISYTYKDDSIVYFIDRKELKVLNSILLPLKIENIDFSDDSNFLVVYGDTYSKNSVRIYNITY